MMQPGVGGELLRVQHKTLIFTFTPSSVHVNQKWPELDSLYQKTTKRVQLIDTGHPQPETQHKTTTTLDFTPHLAHLWCALHCWLLPVCVHRFAVQCCRSPFCIDGLTDRHSGRNVETDIHERSVLLYCAAGSGFMALHCAFHFVRHFLGQCYPSPFCTDGQTDRQTPRTQRSNRHPWTAVCCVAVHVLRCG